jgi:hypothetical protein
MSEDAPGNDDAPEIDQYSERSPRRIRSIVLAPWIVVAVLFAIVLSPIIAASVMPALPLPPGRYSDVSVRFPDAPMSVSSQFLFTGGVPGNRYYAAYPTAATVFQVSGKVVDISAFGYTIERSRPMHVYATADVRGKISLIDVSP